MKNYFSFFNLKVGSAVLVVLATATIGIVAPREVVNKAFADNYTCSTVYPNPVFSPYPETTGNTAGGTGVNAPCYDFPVISGNVQGVGSYLSNFSAQAGQSVTVRIWIHNGAATNSNQPMEGVTYNTVETDSPDGSSHTLTTTLSANNAASKTESITINTPAGSTLQVTSGSLNGSLGELQPCFEYAQQIIVTLTVVTPQQSSGQITNASLNSSCPATINLNWTTSNVPGEAIFDANDPSGQPIGGTASANGPTNIPATPGQTYAFQLWSVNWVGGQPQKVSQLGSTQTVTVPSNTCQQQNTTGQLTATLNSTCPPTVHLVWSTNATGEAIYDQNGQVIPGSASASSYTDVPVTAGNNYTYTLWDVNWVGSQPQQVSQLASQSVNVPSSTCQQSQPSGQLTATLNNTCPPTVHLNWTTSNATGAAIYDQNNQVIPGTGTYSSYTDVPVTAGNNYTYTLWDVNWVGSQPQQVSQLASQSVNVPSSTCQQQQSQSFNLSITPNPVCVGSASNVSITNATSGLNGQQIFWTSTFNGQQEEHLSGYGQYVNNGGFSGQTDVWTSGEIGTWVKTASFVDQNGNVIATQTAPAFTVKDCSAPTQTLVCQPTTSTSIAPGGSVYFSAAGGQAPYTINASGGSVVPASQISGNVTSTGNFGVTYSSNTSANYPVSVTDSAGNTISCGNVSVTQNNPGCTGTAPQGSISAPSTANPGQSIIVTCDFHSSSVTINPPVGSPTAVNPCTPAGTSGTAQSFSCVAPNSGAITYICSAQANSGTNFCGLPQSASQTVTINSPNPPACTTLNFNAGTSRISQTNLNPGQSFTLSCDYGKTGIDSIFPTGTGCVGAQFTGFSGTTANFSCTAPSAAATYPVGCELASGTSSNTCQSTNNFGSITVASNNVVNGACGTAAKTYPSGTSSFGSDTFCSQGNLSASTPNFPAVGAPSTWTCNGSGNGATNATCTATQSGPTCTQLSSLLANPTISLVSSSASGQTINATPGQAFQARCDFGSRNVYIDPPTGCHWDDPANGGVGFIGTAAVFDCTAPASGTANVTCQARSNPSDPAALDLCSSASVSGSVNVSQVCTPNSNYALNASAPVKNGSTYSVTLTWSSTGSHQVKITQISPGSSSETTLTTGSNSGSYTVNNLQPGSQYIFKMYDADSTCGQFLTSTSVNTPANPGQLTCSANASSINSGGSVTFSAQGGSSPYSWQASGGSPSSGNGSSFNTSYTNNNQNSVTQTATVTSNDGQTANCNVIVQGTAPSTFTATATATATASASASCPNGSSASASASATASATATSSISQADAQSKAQAQAQANAQAQAQANAQAQASASCPSNQPVSCSASPNSINVGQSTTFYASNGSGSYSWSVNGGSVTSSAAQSFASTFNSAGSYTATVSSGGHTATCSVNVNANACVVNSNFALNASSPVKNGSTYTVTLTWSSTGNHQIKITQISPGSSGETTLTTGANSGNYVVSGLSAGSNYIFKMYDTDPTCGQFLTTTSVNTPANPGQLTCSANPSIIASGANANFTASGGTAPYNWSDNGALANSQTYSPVYTNSTASPVTHTVTVTSGDGQTANCSVLVNGTTPTNTSGGNCNGSSASCNNNTNTTTQTGGSGSNSSNQNNNNNVNGNNNTITNSNENCVNNSCNNIVYISSNGQVVPANQFSQLSITKLVSANGTGYQNSVSVNNGQTVQFEITVTDTGSTAANNVTMTDNLPSGLSLNYSSVQVSGGNNGYNNYNYNNGNNGYYGNLNNINLGNLNPGQTVNIEFSATVNSGSSTSLQNTATATATNTGSVQASAWVFVNNNNYVVYNPNPGCTYNCGAPAPTGSVNLTYSKSAFNNTKNADATTVTASKEDFITYTLTVSNSGSIPANSFVITDDLSQVLPYADITDNGGGTLSGNVISFPGITVPANGSVSKSFEVRVKYALADNLSYIMTNSYGNTVTVKINNPQIPGNFVAPKTGADTDAFVFSGLLTSAAALFRKRKNLLQIIFT